MSTYFGITSSEAAASPLYDKSYKADAGFNTVGLAGSATYNLTERWKLHALAGWDRLIGDAGNSPIVKEGSENQFYAGQLPIRLQLRLSCAAPSSGTLQVSAAFPREGGFFVRC